MSQNISIDKFVETVEEELLLYSDHIVKGLDEKSSKAVKDLVKKTKDTAPVGKRRKHYKNSITSKKLTSDKHAVAYLWYVKAPDYRLSHLLNNGHATRDGGRVAGTGFISNAEQEVVAKYEKEVEEVIKNG